LKIWVQKLRKKSAQGNITGKNAIYQGKTCNKLANSTMSKRQLEENQKM